MSNLLSVGRGEPDELVELRQEALQVEGRLVLLDSILFSHWCQSLFSPQEARIHHHCFESNVVKHFGLDALHPLSHERQGRTSKLQELHHFVFLLVSPVADALAPFHLGRERIGCMKLCKSRTNWRRLYLPLPLSGLNSAFCPINRFSTRTTFLGKPEFLLIYCCQARFSAAKMPDQTAKIPDQMAKIPDHVG